MPFSGLVREIKTAAVSGVVLAAFAFAGIGALASGAASWLQDYYGLTEGRAQLVVGAAATIPVILFLLANWVGGWAATLGRKSKHKAGAGDLPEALQIRQTVELVQDLTRTSPISAVSLAVMAGFMLMRSPNLLPVVVSTFAAARSIPK